MSGRCEGRIERLRELLPDHQMSSDTGFSATPCSMTARRPEGGMLFRVFLNPDDLRQLLKRAMGQEETAAIMREIAGDGGNNHRRGQ